MVKNIAVREVSLHLPMHSQLWLARAIDATGAHYMSREIYFGKHFLPKITIARPSFQLLVKTYDCQEYPSTDIGKPFIYKG